MTLLPFCQWLAETRGSIALHESLFMYPLVESAHVLTLCLFLGMAIMLDLRLLGLDAARACRCTEITRRLGPWMVAGFVVMVITGGLLFYAIPDPVVPEHLVPDQGRDAGAGRPERVGVSHHGAPPRGRVGPAIRVPPNAARRAGATSLVLWAIIVVAGRMIAYNWFDCDKQPQPTIINVAAGCVVRSRERVMNLLPLFQLDRGLVRSGPRSARPRGRSPSSSRSTCSRSR